MIHQEHYYNLPALLYVLSNALSFSNKIVLPFLPGKLGSSLSNDPECRRIAGGAGGANMLQVLLTDDDDRLRDFRWDIFRVTCSNSRVKDSRIPLSFPWSFSVKLRRSLVHGITLHAPLLLSFRNGKGLLQSLSLEA